MSYNGGMLTKICQFARAVRCPLVVIQPDKCQECLNRASSDQLPTNSYSFLILIVPQSTTTRSTPSWTVKELINILTRSI